MSSLRRHKTKPTSAFYRNLKISRKYGQDANQPASFKLIARAARTFNSCPNPQVAMGQNGLGSGPSHFGSIPTYGFGHLDVHAAL